MRLCLMPVDRDLGAGTGRQSISIVTRGSCAVGMRSSLA